jgi:16S rRNA (cytidine1402-2'-O)-methyltransferase
MTDATLFVVATPIGNLGDLSPRAAAVLREAGLVAAEDTRRTLKLLNHLGISKPLVRCDGAMEERASIRVLKRLAAGESVALVSDAGTPTLSDPGARLVARVTGAGFRAVPLPGPSAIAAALSVAGFRAVPFAFLGFAPRKSGARARLFDSLSCLDQTTVLFESPFRIVRTLEELAVRMPDRRALVAREVSKLHEEYLRGTLSDLARGAAERTPKGEFTLVIAPPERREIRERAGKRDRMDEE